MLPKMKPKLTVQKLHSKFWFGKQRVLTRLQWAEFANYVRDQRLSLSISRWKHYSHIKKNRQIDRSKFQKKLELHKVERQSMTQIIQQLHQSKQNEITANRQHQNRVAPTTRYGNNNKGMQKAIPDVYEIKIGFIAIRAYRLVSNHLRWRWVGKLIVLKWNAKVSKQCPTKRI